MTNAIASRLQFKFAAIVGMILLSHALVAQAPAAPAPAPPLVWKTYTSSSDGFSVSFPGDPSLQKNNIPTDAGSFELRAYLSEPGSAALFVGVCDYGAAVQGRDPQSVLTGAKQGAIDNVKAHITTENKITLGTYPGVEFEADNDTMHFSARIYLVGTTLYQILTASPLTEPFTDSKRFLDSFQLIPRIAN